MRVKAILSCRILTDLLIIAQYFNASKEELMAGGADPDLSIQVKGGGYIAGLGVYHELHCIVSRSRHLP